MIVSRIEESNEPGGMPLRSPAVIPSSRRDLSPDDHDASRQLRPSACGSQLMRRPPAQPARHRRRSISPTEPAGETAVSRLRALATSLAKKPEAG